MTPNFITGLVMSTPTTVADPLALWMDDIPDVRQDLGFATIAIGPRQQAQGPVLRHLRDGRISIDAGGRVLTGHGVTPRPAARSLWARISGRSS
ncbi:hypothetical protein [Paracoccus benzoatiresistens]|uniref:Uncharacterized protein n=1 Tax=Paracoccus benzoatiresistens TaxID=2997341 RepID=A0ABT4J4T9_9RHOB|nr:hypothetical protein [Paracoccus sp. EF6]MCZ0962086.1 hypothetical protein [Paracoccus sp. EF6]